MRSIDADALLEDVRKNSESYFADDFAKYWVDKQPTIEPERKKGKWIWKTWSNYQCSECSHVTNVDECMEEPMYNYCPYCGADMRGDQE